MNKDLILKAIKKLRELSKKRNFSQTFDLVINLRGLDLKKPEHNVDLYVVLPHGKGKKSKVCAFVDEEMVNDAKAAVDFVITKDHFTKYAISKKELKKLVKDYDYFIAQANLMPDVAKVFGKTLGPKGKMPNPKAGCVVPPGVNLKALYEKLQKSFRVHTRNETIIKGCIGKEDLKDEDLEANVTIVYNALVHALPAGEGNVKSVLLKLTMSKPVKVGEENEGKKGN